MLFNMFAGEHILSSTIQNSCSREFTFFIQTLSWIAVQYKNTSMMPCCTAGKEGSSPFRKQLYTLWNIKFCFLRICSFITSTKMVTTFWTLFRLVAIKICILAMWAGPLTTLALKWNWVKFTPNLPRCEIKRGTCFALAYFAHKSTRFLIT